MAEMSKAKKDKKAKAASANRDAATPRSSTWRVRYDNFVEQHATHMFIAAAILFFVAMIALKLAFSYVEGLASAALLIFGAVFLWFYHDMVFPLKFGLNGDSVWPYIGIFAFLGWSLDGAGNRLYNIPVGIFCPPASKLAREVVSIETSDGTELGQAFTCVSRIDGSQTEIAWYFVDLVRVAEYAVIGLVLMFAFRGVLYLRNGK